MDIELWFCTSPRQVQNGLSESEVVLTNSCFFCVYAHETSCMMRWVKSRSTFYICSAHIFSKDSEQRKVLSTLIKTLSLVFWFFWNFSVTFEMKQKSFAVVHVYSFLRPTPTVLDKIKRLLCLLSAAELLLWWWIIKKLK